ncbi:MAG: NUDIX domain-containing protein [bacterium]|nr:NUDIX domain-containing protein [bacterium]
MSHIHEKIDFTVGVFVVYKNKVLLIFHPIYKIWLAVGGHVELNEDPTEAALREVKEETGLDVSLWDGNKPFAHNEPIYHGDPPRRYVELVPPIGMNRHEISSTHEHVDFTYFATSHSDQVILESPEDEYKWFSKDELKSLDVHPDVKFYAELAIEKLKGK